MPDKDPSQRIVAVTGMGTINSAGKNVEQYWQAILSGQRKGIITNEREWLEADSPPAYRKNLRSHLAARIKSEDLTVDLQALSEPAYAHIDERYIERFMSGSAIVGAIAAAEALRSADIIGSVEPERFAFVLGTAIGGATHIADWQQEFEAGKRLPATSLPKTQPENAMIQLVTAFGAKGPSQTVTAACSSGNTAIINAAKEIKHGRADVIVAGGVETFRSLVVALFEMTGAGEKGEDPSVASRAFHPHASGAIVSEGASLLVLEDLAHAKARGAQILAIVAGTAETNDASDPTLMTGEGIERSMDLALAEAEVGPYEYVSINAHATATPKGDPAEAIALTNVFTRGEYSLDQVKDLVYAPKAITGHSLGAANGTEAIAAIKMLQEQTAPPSTWLADGVIEQLERLHTNVRTAQPARIDAVLSNGMGFGGQNTSVVFRSYQE